ncbi:hypothetical protein DPEC_G00100710 [Dallia pectoralis]|uniref:Uncharacterized protein n=1 Tax=Dallia pectoralis TaxID=75939 RepID=A0ACC2GX66_DALPE|nr:hypothetical protein DPEC_G00100710 [Dallia pectoralis]
MSPTCLGTTQHATSIGSGPSNSYLQMGPLQAHCLGRRKTGLSSDSQTGQQSPSNATARQRVQRDPVDWIRGSEGKDQDPGGISGRGSCEEI